MSMDIQQGQRLKELRERLSVGQVEFAKAIGIPQSNLSPWEKGKRPVPLPVLLAACHVYKASRAWLVDGIGPMFESDLDLSGRTPPPTGGIYRADMMGIINAINVRAGAGIHYLGGCLPKGRFEAILAGQDAPTWGELAAIARSLRVPIQEILCSPDGKPLEIDLSQANPLEPVFARKFPTLDFPQEIDAGRPSHGSTTKGIEALRSDVDAIKSQLAELQRHLHALGIL